MLDDAIRKKYEGEAWVILSEVRDGTGYAACRSADTMAFGMWPSRGLDVIGFEIKSNRGDWRRELSKPKKADDIACYCDEWWIVGAEDVVLLEEVPKTWGWYVPHGKTLKAKKQPERKPEHPELDRTFIMSVLRNFSRSYIPRSKVRAEVDAGIKIAERNKGYRLESLERIEKRVLEFKETSGINLKDTYSWPAGEVGEVVRAVLDKRLGSKLEQVKNTLKALEEIGAEIRDLPFMRKPKEDEKKCATS